MNKIAQILTNNINITEINYDFNSYRSRHHLFFKNKKHELQIRYTNLHDVINVLNKYNILHWLQGKTMLGIHKYKGLLKNDTDEDIGTDFSNIKKICVDVIPKLQQIGFKVIRATKNNSMVTVMRNNRYIDICFFRTIKDKYYYEKKIFPKAFYNTFMITNVNDFKYNIPEKADEICKYSYNI
jgi:hypothetical protein